MKPSQAAGSEVKIEAAGQVDYDFDSNTTTATNKVTMTSEDVLMEADSLVYDGNKGIAYATGNVRATKGDTTLTALKVTYYNVTGVVEASGAVHFHTKQGDYRTETVTYNLKDSSGRLSQFSGTVPGKDRDYLVNGQGATTTDTTTEVAGASLTRCPLPKPDYLFSAKTIRMDDQKIHLEQVVLKLKGIPVFYFPSLTLDKNEKRLPRLDLGYSKDDGLKFGYEYSTPRNDHQEWRFLGQLSTKNDSKIGVGLGSYWDNLSNTIDVDYNTQGFIGLSDKFKIDFQTMLLELDGSRDFSSEADQQLSFSLSSKSWETPLGKWQAGILGRQLSTKLDHTTIINGQTFNAGNFEGAYTGYRLDYTPVNALTVTFINLYDVSQAGADQWVYLEDHFMKDYHYRLGANILYTWALPINRHYGFNLDGSYNFKDNDWVRQAYTFISTTCCFQTSLGWNAVDHSLELQWRIKF